MFPLTIPPGIMLYHYDVTIVPGKCPRALNRAVMKTLVEKYHVIFKSKYPAFDGTKNLYSRERLEFNVVGGQQLGSSVLGMNKQKSFIVIYIKSRVNEVCI